VVGEFAGFYGCNHKVAPPSRKVVAVHAE
jgi:hypothetical protein